MPEFRQNLVTGEWVILAQERAKRPHDHGAERSRCPFCPGNEERTPDPVLVVDGDAVLGCDWAIRVVPNKFPALTPEGTPTEGHVGPYSTMTGVGAHDVVVESPVHDDGLATYAVEHLARVLGVWAERHNQLFRDPRFKYVQILKNHGQGSGGIARASPLPDHRRAVRAGSGGSGAYPRGGISQVAGHVHALRPHRARDG